MTQFLVQKPHHKITVKVEIKQYIHDHAIEKDSNAEKLVEISIHIHLTEVRCNPCPSNRLNS